MEKCDARNCTQKKEEIFLKTKNAKKLLALFVAVLMLLSVAPLSAFAEGTTETNDTLTWNFDEETATLTVSGEGAVPDYDFIGETVATTAPWYSVLMKTKKIVISEGITSVGKLSFAFNTAKEIVMPSTLKSIGESAFAYSIEIEEFNLPEGLETIAIRAFTACTSLKKIYIPSTVKDIDKYAFLEIYSAELTDIVNLSDSAVARVADSSMLYFKDKKTAVAYAEYIKHSFYFELLQNIEIMDNEDEFLIYCMDFINEIFGTSFTSDDVYEFDNWISQLFTYYTVVLPDYFSVTCKEGSAQHEYCKENGVKHNLIETGEECECFAFSGTYGENATWTIDKESRTLIFDGTGELQLNADGVYSWNEGYVKYPGYMYLNRYFDNVTFAEGSSITKAEEDTFDNLILKNVNLPASFSEVEPRRFTSDSYTESLTVDENNEKYFARDGVVFEKTADGNALVCCPSGKLGEYTVPEDTAIIRNGAFGYSWLDKLIIPESIKELEASAFINSYFDVYVYNKDIKVPEKEGNENVTPVVSCFYGTVYCYPDSTISFDTSRENDYNRCGIVIFEDKEVDHIAVETLPDRCEYIRRFDRSPESDGLVLRVYFKDGTSVLRKSGYRTNLRDLDCNKIGTVTVTVSYRTYENNRFETTYDVEMKDVDHVDIRSGESKTEDIGYGAKEGGRYFFKFTPSCSGDYVVSWSSNENIGTYLYLDDENLDDIETIAGYQCEYSSKTITFEEGKTYYFRASGYEWAKVNNFTLSIACAEHKESDWIIDIPATCLEGGTRHTECRGCGKLFKTEDVAPTGHALSDWIIDTDATCTAVGSKHKECLNCGETLETAEIPAKGHTPSAIPGKAATCEEDGLTEGSVCSVCNTVLTAQETIPATGHSDANDDGKCDSCGKTLRESTIIDKIKDFFKRIIDWFKKLFP